MADLVVTLSGNEAKLAMAMRKIIDQQAAMENGFEKVKKKSKEANDEASKGKGSIETMRDGIAGMVTGFTSVSGVVSTINGLMQEQISMQKESLDIISQIAKSQSGASKNMTGFTTAEKRRVFKMTRDIQAETGFADQNAMIDAFGSSTGVVDGTNEEKIKKVGDTIRAAAPLARLEPEKLKELSRASLNIGRVTGTDSAIANLSFLQSAADISFVDDNAQVAKNVTPAIVASLSNFKGENSKVVAAEVAAIFAELTKGGADAMGDSSSTATISFMRHLADVTNEVGGTPLQRLQAVQNSPELRDKLFSDKFGEERFKAIFQELTTLNSQAAKSVAENATKVSFDPSIYQKQVSEEEQLTEESVTATMKARGEGQSQARKKAENANKELVRERVTAAMRASRKGGVVGNTLDYMYEAVPFNRVDVASATGSDIDTINAGIDELQRRQRAIRNTTGSLLFGVSERDQAKIERLDREIEELQKFGETIKKVRSELEGVSATAGKVVENLEKGSDAAKNLAKQRGAQSVGRE